MGCCFFLSGCCSEAPGGRSLGPSAHIQARTGAIKGAQDTHQASADGSRPPRRSSSIYSSKVRAAAKVAPLSARKMFKKMTAGAFGDAAVAPITDFSINGDTGDFKHAFVLVVFYFRVFSNTICCFLSAENSRRSAKSFKRKYL